MMEKKSISHTAIRSERLSMKVKLFNMVLSKFKEDITNQIITLIKKMIGPSREGTNKNLVEQKKEMLNMSTQQEKNPYKSSKQK